MHARPRIEPTLPNVQSIRPATELTIQLTPFDRREYRALIEARDHTLRRIVKGLKPALSLSNAVDVGCRVGFFSQTLAECGLQVCGFDARGENVAEARRRFPGISFERANIEDREIAQLGQFDFVLCFGLLYHLENPLQAIRNLHALTDKCLLLESMCLPGERCSLLLLQEPRQGDQSLTEIACYASEGSLVKMLYRAGFAKVYRVRALPDHDDFRETREHKQRRTVLLAEMAPIDESPTEPKIHGRKDQPRNQRYLDPLGDSWPARCAKNMPRWRIARVESSRIWGFLCGCRPACGGWQKRVLKTSSFFLANTKPWAESLSKNCCGAT